jgi:hypothetical protein
MSSAHEGPIKKVFLSSTGEDLHQYRDAAFTAIQRLPEIHCERMEDWGANESQPLDLCKRKLLECDLYVGIIGHCYGSIPPSSDRSFTEWEYDLATEYKIPRLIFMAPDDFPVAARMLVKQGPEQMEKIKAFRERIGREITYAAFRDPRELASEIVTAIYKQLAKPSSKISPHENDWKEIRRDYLESVRAHFEEWNARYTELRVTTDIRVATYKGVRIGDDDKASQLWFEEIFSKKSHSDKPSVVVVLGDPGAGKTTACQRAVWSLAKKSLKNLDRPVASNITIPVYIDLGKFRTESYGGLRDYQQILALIAAEMQYILAKRIPGIQIDHRTSHRYIVQDSFVFFFDGLNEVGRQHRDALIAGLEAFIGLIKNSGHQVLITTRKMDYEFEIQPSLPMEKYPPMEILEFDNAGLSEFVMRDLGEVHEIEKILAKTKKSGQAREILDRLIKGRSLNPWEDIAALKVEVGTLSSDLQAGFEQGMKNINLAQNLLSVLHEPDYSRILWLSQNPSTLRDVVDVYRYFSGDLPQSRIQLLKNAVLARMVHQKKTKPPELRDRIPDDLKFKAMQQIAFKMTDPSEGLQMKREQALKLISEVLKGYSQPFTPETLLHEVEFNDGLIVERAKGYISFVKQPYQEFFAVQEIYQRWKNLNNEGKDPLRSNELKQFFSDRSFFQLTSGIAGLLGPQEAQNLVDHLSKRRSSRMLAALCIRNMDPAPGGMISGFLQSTKKRILKYAKVPCHLSDNAFLFLVICASGFISVHLSAYDMFKTFTMALIYSASSFKNAIWSALITIALGISANLLGRKFVLRKGGSETNSITFHLNLKKCFWVSLFSLILVMGYLAKAYLPGITHNILYILATMTFLAFVYVTCKLIVFVLVECLNIGTVWTEEYLVKHHLIPLMETIRELGPMAVSHILEIRHEFSQNNLMSPRISDAVNRTWAVSPKTFFQLEKNLDKTETHAEAVEVIMIFAQRSDVAPGFRKELIEKIFSIAKLSPSIGTVCEALDKLSVLAKQYTETRKDIVQMLLIVLDDKQRDVQIRRFAYSKLKELGLKEIKYPKRNQHEKKQFALKFLYALAGIMAVVFLGYLIWGTKHQVEFDSTREVPIEIKIDSNRPTGNK